MARFAVKRLAGEAVDVVEVDAANADEARRVVVARGGRALGVTRRVAPRLTASSGRRFDLQIFNRQLLALLAAGQPLVDAIEILGRHDPAGRSRLVYAALLSSLRQGRSFSTALGEQATVFPPLYVAMVRASERTGATREAIQRYLAYQEQVEGIRAKLRAALVYPAVLVVVGCVVVAFLMLYVVPRFATAFDDLARQQSSLVAAIQAWSHFVRDQPGLAWGGLLVLVAGTAWLALAALPRRWLSARVQHMPGVGRWLWIFELARLYRTLGMLLRSGVGIVPAMQMAECALSPGAQDRLRLAASAVAEGMPLSAVMPRHELASEVAQRLLIAGESSGNLDEMMGRIADFHDQETAAWIDLAGRLVEPVLMVAIGLVIGAIVIGLYMPIFELANAI